METRENRILELLKNKKSYLTGKQLAKMLGVSDRSIRNDIVNLNSRYPGIIDSSVRYGYKLNEEVLEQSDIVLENVIPQTSAERCSHILKKLLFKNKVSMLDLETELYVSDSTIKKDLKLAEDAIKSRESLRIVKNGNLLVLEGSEEDKRSIYKELLSMETNGSFISIDKIANLFPSIDLIRIKNDLENTFVEYGYKVRGESFPLLMIHIGVAVIRMMNCNNLEAFSNSIKIMESEEYAITSAFFNKITRYLNINVNDYEKALFASLLIGRRKNSILNNLESSEVMTDKIIQSIKDNYDIDLTNDSYFKQGIVIHIHNLIDRVNNSITLSNMCLAEIKKTYPLVFEIAVSVAHIVEKSIGHEISEDEIGFLAMHIGAAYDRLHVNQYYHAVLIIPSSHVMSDICVEKINSHFKDRMIIDGVLNYYEEKAIEKFNPDLILSTVHLDVETDISLVNISMFVNDNDEYKIFTALSNLEKKRQRISFKFMLKNLIVDDFYFYNLEADDYTELINTICDKLLKENRVKVGFKEAVFKREAMAYTSFSNGFAIPHALGFYSLVSTIVIAKLKKPVLWGKHEVSFVLLLAIKEEDKNLLRVFFDWFGGICDDEILMGRMLEAKTCDEFKEMVLNYEK